MAGASWRWPEKKGHLQDVSPLFLSQQETHKKELAINRVTIQPTIFENIPQGTQTYGYRMYDDCGHTYCNAWDCIPDDDMDILVKTIASTDEASSEMFDFIIEQETGIAICDNWYSWDEIKHLFV